jgi:hypothetical protein
VDALDELLAGLVEDIPTDPEKRREWVDGKSVELAALMAEAAALITRHAATAYAESLVAAGDLAALDGMEALWSTFVTEVVGEYTGGMYLAGNLSAFVGRPGLDLPPEVAGRWASVVNENAVAYQAAATNRIVGASTDMWSKVRDDTQRAIEVGMSNEELKSAIEDVTGYSEFRADAIGRTEAQAAYSGGDIEGARALGEFGPVAKRWLAALDARTRETHAFADGQLVGLDEPFDVGGVLMDRPLDPGAPPGEVVNCRCTMEMIYAEDLTDDERAALGVAVEGI